MPQEGAMLMSRLEMVSPTRAKIVMECKIKLMKDERPNV